MKVGLKNTLFLLTAFTFFVLAVFADVSETFAINPDRLKTLIGAKSLKCTFGPGAAASWESGEPKISNGEWNVTLHFDAIDLKLGKARLIGNQGAGDVLVYPTISGLSFIEETVSGNLVFTTVFSRAIKGSEAFVGVHSRHMDFFGHLVSSQYHGTCEILDSIQ